MAPAKVIYQHTDLFDPPLLFQLLNQDLLRSAELFFCGADRQHVGWLWTGSPTVLLVPRIEAVF